MGNIQFSHLGISFSLLLLISLLTPSKQSLNDQQIFPPEPDQVEINLVERINSTGMDFCPTPYRNGLVFTSSRGNEKAEGVTGIFKEKYFDIYYSERNEYGNYVIPAKMNGEVNTDLHDGPATFSLDGFTMYFTRNRALTKKGLVALKIYSAELIGGEWTNIVELPFNSEKFSNSHPTLSKDGQRLYFSSDRKGGFGGMDIYVSEKIDGVWGEPRNAGITVNSDKNEIFPYIDYDNTLYYASDREEGWGKLDIYMSETNGKVLGAAQNLGAPFNSSADDFGFIIDRKKEKGFLSSNRSGGKGKDDIYEWKIKEDKAKIRRVILVDKLSGKRISSAEINVKVGLENTTSERLEEIKQGIYKLKMYDSNGYIVNVEKYGYRPLKLVFQKEDLMAKDEHIFYLHKRSMSVLNGEVKNLVDASKIGSAKIELISECDGRKQFATTNVDGTFGFSLMCDCEYTIVVNKDGFKTNHMVIPLHKNKCQENNLIQEVMTLQPAVLIRDRARIDP